MTSQLEHNAQDLERELAWFSRLLDGRFGQYLGEEARSFDVREIPPPELAPDTSAWAQFVHHYELGLVERLGLVLALVPHLRPRLLDVFFLKNQTFDRPFTEFGGRVDASGAFKPTLETLVFLLGPDSLTMRFQVEALFQPRHVFARHRILVLEPLAGESAMRATLKISDEYLSLLTVGEPRRPDFGAHFPARYIETPQEWDDLVLHPGTRKQIDEIETWLCHGQTLMDDWGMATKLRPGYRCLFYGPPGTGKTMTACLLGKSTGRDVYKVDLSLVISKYIGETEKNLAKVFDQAQSQHWLLFFDEADALFGKRSETKDSHDRYANQEVSFLLQRIETFDGIAILASNRRENLDEAFTRRFESVIYFPVPRPEERLSLWRRGFSAKAELAPELDLDRVAREHVLSGGSIMNVIRFASLKSIAAGTHVISGESVLQGIRREYAKEGKAA